ncbi:MAG: hypothetical protein M1834_005467 [Cirrosporium novae-zelandiae]|nr:MAG: hypothetical protein M1834_005467 [Cirrosporium novae-zelandiae]
MAFVNPGFLLGILVILYLFTFVLFAILRIIAGISVQRIGYFSLRRISYTLKEGIIINIHSLGLQIHRPTLTRPTWLTLRITGLSVTIESKTLKEQGKDGNSISVEAKAPITPQPDIKVKPSTSPVESSENVQPTGANEPASHSDAWVKLTRLKEKIKLLHRKIQWLQLIDVHATESSCIFPGVAELQVGSFLMLVDTRRRTVDRGRLFRHKKEPVGNQKPAEWMLIMNGVLFASEGKESIEIVDLATLNVHGLLIPELDGLRDASISLKLGRVHIPYDDFIGCYRLLTPATIPSTPPKSPNQEGGVLFDQLVGELEKPESHEDKIIQTVSDSKNFASSILGGIQEIQLGISFIGMSTQIHSLKTTSSPMYLNAAMNEFGIDLHRLDSKTPAHRMYFPKDDVAHQALLAAISISISVDDGRGSPNRLIYIPMATTTIKTTLPSKTVTSSDDKDAATRNSNILFANLVMTSPSVDLDPRHLPIVLTLFQSKKSPSPVAHRRGHLISRLLPKANVKFSIHEPVLRIVLPPTADNSKDSDDYEMLIASISSISLDVESCHSSGGALHYSLASSVRVSSHEFYYQTSLGERHNLLMSESLELKVQMSASPEVYIVASGNIRSVSMHMVKPEVSLGIRQFMRQLRQRSGDEKSQIPNSAKSSVLRRLPPWLLEFYFEGSDISLEVAGIDADISKCTRGVALQLESWSAEYKAQKDDPTQKRQSRRRTISRSIPADDAIFLRVSPPAPARKRSADQTDGRRLALHVRNLEGFVIESLDVWEPENFLSLPRFEVALSTSNDSHGPIFHINSYLRSFFLNYSLYRFYAIGLAATVLQQAFRIHPFPPTKDPDTTPSSPGLSPSSPSHAHMRSSSTNLEITVVDVKATVIQIKGTMPLDPPMMLQVYGLEAGRHRWSAPFLKSKLLRLYAEAPKVKRVWARIVSVKNLRVDLRRNRKKRGKEIIEEKSVDLAMDFIRLGIPHQLVMHHIFDNFVNTMKATDQLIHRFKTGTNEYVLEKLPVGPKRVPRISVRTKSLAFEIEDSPFEWKLGCIYRTGLLEQKQRLAREEAFNLKAKKLEELEHRRGTSRYRAQSSHLSGRPRTQGSTRPEMRPRSKSVDPHARQPSPLGHRRGRSVRYDTSGRCGFTSSARISIEEARLKLQQHNAQSWKKRIDATLRSQGTAINDIRSLFWGADEITDDEDCKEPILSLPARPGLMTALVSDVHLILDKPSFPIQEYPKFLHKIGKGMPLDMKYALLVPVGIQLHMGEARVTLRDYPIPFLHVPAIRAGQSPRLPSWSVRTDFVVAEEYRDSESMRYVKVDIIPPDSSGQREPAAGFAVNVKRTVSPVKTYSEMAIEVNSSLPTCISWGTSYQPVIQDMMMVFEGFSKPQVDPSDRVGFWDKIRISFHSRMVVSWKGDGDVHLRLKGSRDPYAVTGFGSGFIMCWRNDVKWLIHASDDPRKFMQVLSGEYVLAIPDYSKAARQAMEQKDQDSESVNSGSSTNSSNLRSALKFRKVVMKLSGNVEWTAGLMVERNTDDGQRSFDFKPHYEIVLKNPKFAKPSNGQAYDAFRGFRSHHIHLSLSIVAPVDRDWSVHNAKPSMSYNTVHLTPKLFTHFFSWWTTFSGPMALPVRQGRLWPGVEKSSKKFGRHLATIKYNLLLSPVFVAHIYKHKDAEDYAEQDFAATGLKLRIDSFMLDLHQRREEFTTQIKGQPGRVNTSAMRINQTQLDMMSADVRAVSATIRGTSVNDIKQASDESLASFQEPTSTVDLSKFTIPDKDFSWIDMDDFVETDWILPDEPNPETQILPLAFAPRFTYFRQTDHNDNISRDTSRSSPFGNEPTHFCIMSEENDPRRVQLDLIKERLESLEEQMAKHRREIGDQELRVIQDGHNMGGARERLEMLLDQDKLLNRKKTFLQSGMYNLSQQLKSNNSHPISAAEFQKQPFSNRPPTQDENLESAPFSDFISDFNNRFIVHNMQLKWNNSLRNIILRYIHQVSQRRGYVYYMSRKAVKFILDIIEEQSKSKETHGDIPRSSTEEGPEPSSPASEASLNDSLEDRIHHIIDRGSRYVDSKNEDVKAKKKAEVSGEKGEDVVSEEFALQNSYHVRLIAPQIQFQSEKSPKSCVLVTAEGMQLKVIQVMDKDRMTDDISGLVQRRFTMHMDGAQFFVSSQKKVLKNINLYSGNRYGNPKNSAWPPWVSLEVMFDFDLNPVGFDRVIQRTSASLRYDKFNTLRLKSNDEVASGDQSINHSPDRDENDMDRLWFDFPKIRAVCDSSQYYAIYLVVLDLLMYNEPLEKVRSERLEKIMLASDFSDLRGAPEMVISLQNRIQQLEEIKTHFQVNEKYLDRQGWQDRLAVEQDLASCEDELFFMMKAITTSQRRPEERATEQTSGLLRWNLSASELVWHLMREKNEPLMEFQLREANFQRTDNSDGSNYNEMTIKHIRGLNLLPDTIYPDMIGPFFEQNQDPLDYQDVTMFQMQWCMLEAIAGIPVLDDFEVTLFPMRIQLERETGKRLFEYVFPGIGAKSFDNNSGVSPLLVKHKPPSAEDQDSDEEGLEQEGMEMSQTVGDEKNRSEPHTRTGSLDLRLRPTLSLPPSPRPSTSPRPKGNEHPLRLFQQQQERPTTSRSTTRGMSKKSSADSLRLLARRSTSSSNNTTKTGQAEKEKTKRFALPRSSSKEEKPSDDLTQMMTRASNYMILAHAKVPSVVLCLSYKGRGERNIEDVHDFVFRLPPLEYRNKTWSNLDLALRLKKDVIKALISHTGAIIGNKFSHHRPNKAKVSHLREMVNSSQLLPNTDSLTNPASDSSSMYGPSVIEGRPSSEYSRTDSFTSSIQSVNTTSPVDQRSIREPNPQAYGTNGHLDVPTNSASVRANGGLEVPRPFSRNFTGDTIRARRRASSADEPEDK